MIIIYWGEYYAKTTGAINYPDGPSDPLANSYNLEKKNRCGGIVESLFNTEKDGSGEKYTEGSSDKYYFLDESVTPIMSIGLGLDKMQRADLFDDPIEIAD